MKYSDEINKVLLKIDMFKIYRPNMKSIDSEPCQEVLKDNPCIIFKVKK